ncbi:TolC family protein [Paraglaciecola sp. L3A3]|uniref:TolC family protein n=1 Tax=Paraglaciecola sp. L3A3 TaxID=2686358 RepID=UPI00131CEE85|nr:TolC family protein [Paraglaciecola sp. L3A3]
MHLLVDRKTIFIDRSKLISLSLFSLLFLSNSSWANLTLPTAIKLAKQDDVWLKGSELTERALLATGEASDSLPDPSISVDLLNLPTDGFDFSQEPMSQFKLAISQNFTRGASRQLKQKQYNQLAAQHPLLRKNRLAELELTVSQLYLDAFAAQQAINHIAKDRPLFEQLIETINASYTSTQGNSQQQDILQARIKLALIDDHSLKMQQQLDTALAQLSRWLPESNIKLADSKAWPEITKFPNHLTDILATQQIHQLADLLSQHPAVLAIQQQIKAKVSAVDLAKQKYQPLWGVSASYAYRDDDPFTGSRADFFSVGIKVELPLFSNQRNDNEVAAASYQARSIETEKRLLIKKMLGQVNTLYKQSINLEQRYQGYKQNIIPQLEAQHKAALAAFSQNDGQLVEVIEAQIKQHDAHVEMINISKQTLKTQAHLAYLLGHASSQNDREVN